MVTLRCGGGAAAYLVAQRITSPQNGDGRSTVLSVRAGIGELPLGASSSPSSQSPRTVRCYAGPSPRVKRRCFQNRGVPEGWEALKAAAADMFRPLCLNLSDMRSINTVYDLTDYQIGMLYGFILFMVLKDFHNKYVLLDAIRMPLFLLYLGAFMFDVAGLKKYGRRILISFVNLLKRRGGVEEIFRIVWWRGYVSPYDD
ncbi:hypothetical protein ACQ4PT_058415 [Festuca glaucescens]